MKPTSKQISTLQVRIAKRLANDPISYADLARATGVDPSQVGRICRGDFKTFSDNLMQICRVLKVKVPRISPKEDVDREWSKVYASVSRICREHPNGAKLLRRALDAIADLQGGAA
jgi:transcriptional regulator with XRE-family HTH domain